MACEKISYATRAEAKADARMFAKGKRGVTLHTYRCPKCGNFHLTSLSKQRQREISRRIDSQRRGMAEQNCSRAISR